MTHLKPYSLWLGHAGDGRNIRQLFDTGIQAVVHLAAEEPSPPLPRDLLFFRFPLVDSAENNGDWMHLALVTVAHLLKMRVPTLVYCSAGQSRTPVVVAGALAVFRQAEPEQCLKEVLKGRPADVLPALWADMKTQWQQIMAFHDHLPGQSRNNRS